MKLNSDIRRDVEAELRWAPDVDDTDIAVKVNGGEVTLAGFAPTYLQKHHAEIAVRRVKGVAAVANDIQVKPLLGGPTDPELARAALAALKSDLPLSWEHIQISVKDGRISLTGAVEWNYQRERAESTMRRLDGVVSVYNSVDIKPSVAPENIQLRIEDAFRRLAHVDAGQIKVEIAGPEVTLNGEVRSWAERDQAQQTAWSAPGVRRVINQLSVRS
jgi:osmotically-inducible protein OsmY